MSPSGAELLDFRLAKRTRVDDVEATSTAEGTVLAKAAHMSPEQAQGSVLEERSDVFSLVRCCTRW